MRRYYITNRRKRTNCDLKYVAPLATVRRRSENDAEKEVYRASPKMYETPKCAQMQPKPNKMPYKPQRNPQSQK